MDFVFILVVCGGYGEEGCCLTCFLFDRGYDDIISDFVVFDVLIFLFGYRGGWIN